MHTAALFVHLALLVLGFGAVLVADYYGLLWLTGRCTLDEAVGCTGRLHVPLWAGLTGLVVSGVVLHPDLASPATRTKLVLVLVLALNGLQAKVLHRRVAEHLGFVLSAVVQAVVRRSTIVRLAVEQGRSAAYGVGAVKHWSLSTSRQFL
ncbi:hypothetical protein ABZV31_30590 [Streptomyces sp. NPDC005202]|uniref:hypothetical protein n=1 Tax=Streptomyces sp. NPDC005202 TaxID=3157021 RepID=UPI0033BF62BE